MCISLKESIEDWKMEDPRITDLVSYINLLGDIEICDT